MGQPVEEIPVSCDWGRAFFNVNDKLPCPELGEFEYQLPGAVSKTADDRPVVTHLCAVHLAMLQTPPPLPPPPTWWGDEHTLRVLAAFQAMDTYDGLFWRVDGEYAPVTFFADCSDAFDPATADFETITVTNLKVLESSIKDVTAALGFASYHAVTLFVGRVRKVRPAVYPQEAPAIWPLFDACGPAPDVEVNPLPMEPVDPKPTPVPSPTKKLDSSDS